MSEANEHPPEDLTEEDWQALHEKFNRVWTERLVEAASMILTQAQWDQIIRAAHRLDEAERAERAQRAANLRNNAAAAAEA
jgi:hypothetical protein